jgi:protein kinase C substrate 80K-H
MKNSVLIFIMPCILVTIGSAQATRPRGVRPDMAGMYDPNDSFHCLDGSAEIPFDHVNDDYCDCQVN